MATHIPYHRWILISKSIQSVSAKLCRRNQLTPDRKLSSQTPVIPQRALQTPGAKKISLRACCGLDEGMVSAFPVLLPAWNWSRGIHTDTQRHGAPSVQLVQETKKARCLQIVSPSVFLLPLAFFYLLAKLRHASAPSPAAGKRGAEKLFHVPSSWTSSAGGKHHAAKGMGGEN